MILIELGTDALKGSGALQVSASAEAAAFGSCSDFQTSASGLQWCDVQEGTGKSPAKGASIKAHYTGRLASNGAVFDSSYERRKPLTFKAMSDPLLTSLHLHCKHGTASIAV